MQNPLHIFDANPAYIRKLSHRFLQRKVDEFRQKGMDSILIRERIQDWERRLAGYRGKLIGTLSLGDSDTYIWDSREKRFVLFYSH